MAPSPLHPPPPQILRFQCLFVQSLKAFESQLSYSECFTTKFSYSVNYLSIKAELQFGKNLDGKYSANFCFPVGTNYKYSSGQKKTLKYTAEKRVGKLCQTK